MHFITTVWFQSRAQFKEQEHLALERYMRAVSHDLRTPVNAIMATIDSIIEDVGDIKMGMVEEGQEGSLPSVDMGKFVQSIKNTESLLLNVHASTHVSYTSLQWSVL